jgi:hypothetical protein
MYTAQGFMRKLDTRCLPCFALHRERASVPPHEMLRLVASVMKPTGTREEFTCATCGQTMVRFVAKQTNPPPSDVWRNEKPSAAPSAPAVVEAPADTIDDSTLEPELEEDTFDADALPAAVSYEGAPEYDDSYDSGALPSAVSYESTEYDHVPPLNDEAPSAP